MSITKTVARLSVLAMISTFAFSLGGGGGVASAAPATYMACSTDSGFLVFYDFFGCPFGTHLVWIGGSRVSRQLRQQQQHRPHSQ